MAECSPFSGPALDLFPVLAVLLKLALDLAAPVVVLLLEGADSTARAIALITVTAASLVPVEPQFAG
jgi:hypothetical protein